MDEGDPRASNSIHAYGRVLSGEDQLFLKEIEECGENLTEAIARLIRFSNPPEIQLALRKVEESIELATQYLLRSR